MITRNGLIDVKWIYMITRNGLIYRMDIYDNKKWIDRSLHQLNN